MTFGINLVILLYGGPFQRLMCKHFVRSYFLQLDHVECRYDKRDFFMFFSGTFSVDPNVMILRYGKQRHRFRAPRRLLGWSGGHQSPLTVRSLATVLDCDIAFCDVVENLFASIYQCPPKMPSYVADTRTYAGTCFFGAVSFF